jgi:hypothetical protein
MALTDRTRVSAAISRRAIAPGAEEFVPPADGTVWLPPQRTFSALAAGTPLEAETTNHLEAGVAHDMGPATMTARAFHQHVNDQIATIFGLDAFSAPTHLGHYFVSTVGDVDAAGWGAGIRTPIVPRVRGSIEYSQTMARWNPAANALLVLMSPAVERAAAERLHDVSTTVEAEVPETATRVIVLYRFSSAFAASDRPGVDTRFDVQLRQSLPFMDFSSAKWEMLLAVRNVFHDAAADSSVYDELLVVHPPKRIVGGLTLKF